MKLLSQQWFDFLATTGLLAGPERTRPPAQQGQSVTYTCPMHPEIRQQGPGKCPKCGMALVPEGKTDGNSEKGSDLNPKEGADETNHH